MVAALDAGRATAVAAPDVAAELRRRLAEASVGERRELVVAFLAGEVSRILRVDGSRPLDPRHRLMDLGFDSLMAVEFRNRLVKTLGLQKSLPASLIFDYQTIEALARYLDSEVLGADQAPEAEAAHRPAPVSPSVTVAEVEKLSEEEAEARLLKKLGSLSKT
jgi:Fe2+ transport system protein FeoA